MAKKNNFIANFKRATREMRKTNKTPNLQEFLSGLSFSIKPYINIIFIAKIVGILENNSSDIKSLFIYASVMISLNFILTVFAEKMNIYTYKNYYKYAFVEEHNINSLLLKCDYKMIESTEFDTLLRKYKDTKIYRSNLSAVSLLVDLMTCSFFTLIIGIIMIAPILKLTVVKTGDSFTGSPLFALTIGAVIAVAALIIFFVQKKENKTLIKSSEEHAILSKNLNYYTDLINNYQNGKEIRIFGVKKLIEKDATEQLLTKGIDIVTRQSKSSGRNNALTAVVGVLAALGIYLFIGLKGLSGAFGLSELVLYLGSFLAFVEGIMRFIGVLTSSINVNKSIRYYFDIIDYFEEVDENPTIDLDENYSVEFRNVSFKYGENDNYALKNISLTINKGDKIAIVGQNGSGKTTFIKLLTKLYKDYEGEILFCGHNIKNLNEEQYWAYFSVIFQDFKIFALTLKENITSYGKCQEDDLKLAIKKANISNFVDQLEHKENTFLTKEYEKDGVDISGGEGQKIAIARAFYKKADFMILDEPTAALDPMAEAEFYSSFNEFTENKTSLYISHRLSSCIFCPKIIVFNEGEIVQIGSHQELVSDTKSKYYELWNSQAQHYI